MTGLGDIGHREAPAGAVGGVVRRHPVCDDLMVSDERRDGMGNMVRGEYGVLESNGITDEVRATRDAIDHQAPVWLDDPQLAKVTRLRLVSDPGFPFWDVSYVYGELKDGTEVRVNLPESQFPKRGLKGAIISMARDAGVYAKGLGLLDDDVISKLL